MMTDDLMKKRSDLYELIINDRNEEISGTEREGILNQITLLDLQIKSTMNRLTQLK